MDHDKFDRLIETVESLRLEILTAGSQTVEGGVAAKLDLNLVVSLLAQSVIDLTHCVIELRDAGPMGWPPVEAP